jgi:hypothetical protein
MGSQLAITQDDARIAVVVISGTIISLMVATHATLCLAGIKGNSMNIKKRAVQLSELGYSKAQIDVLDRTAEAPSITIVMSGFVASIKSSAQARILRSMRVQATFRAKRKRRESRHQK